MYRRRRGVTRAIATQTLGAASTATEAKTIIAKKYKIAGLQHLIPVQGYLITATTSHLGALRTPDEFHSEPAMQPKLPAPSPLVIVHPGPLGLATFALTTFMLSLANSGSYRGPSGCSPRRYCFRFVLLMLAGILRASQHFDRCDVSGFCRRRCRFARLDNLDALFAEYRSEDKWSAFR